MAPLPDNNTARFWMDYTVNDRAHSLMVRYNPTLATPTDVADTLASLLGFISAVLADTWAVTGARISAEGSNFSTPFSLAGTDLLGVVGTGGALADNQEPRELVYVGRSGTSGRRTRFSLYGGIFTTPANFRLGPGETAFANSAVFALLNTAGTIGMFLAIDETPAVWYSYVNVNYNSYWETEIRNS